MNIDYDYASVFQNPEAAQQKITSLAKICPDLALERLYWYPEQVSPLNGWSIIFFKSQKRRLAEQVVARARNAAVPQL